MISSVFHGLDYALKVMKTAAELFLVKLEQIDEDDTSKVAR